MGQESQCRESPLEKSQSCYSGYSLAEAFKERKKAGEMSSRSFFMAIVGENLHLVSCWHIWYRQKCSMSFQRTTRFLGLHCIFLVRRREIELKSMKEKLTCPIGCHGLALVGGSISSASSLRTF